MILDEFAKMLVNVSAVNGELLTGAVRGVERQRFQQPFEHRVQASSADVFGLLVHLKSHFGKPPHAVIAKTKLQLLGCHNSTRMGKRPCSSGIRSEGLDK